ncbi:ABC transporter substrate-binding protein [Nonomuraea sp. NPDC004297]
MPTAQRLLAPAAAGLAAVALAACTPVQPSSAADSAAGWTDTFGTEADPAHLRRGGTLVFGLSADPDKLDPATTTSLVAKHVFSSFCESLYSYNPDTTLSPQLATSAPRVSEDGRTYTIPLRQDAVFADGERLTADAVVKTLQRNLKMPTSQRRSELGPVTSIRSVDEHTVEVAFSRPYAPFTSVLADRPGMILSPKALDALGDGFGGAPVCVGPFRYVKRVAGTSITVEKDPLYYDADKVHLDKIEYRIVPDANVRAANLRTDAIHVTDMLSPQDMEALRKTSVQLLSAPSLGFQGVHVNLANQDGIGKPKRPLKTPLASQKLIREALSVGVDRETLAKAVFGGWYTAACGPIAAASPFATPRSQSCPAYDPARSRELLRQAGAQIPFPIELKVPNQQDPLRYAQALQANVEEAGFQVTVVPTEFSTMLADTAKGDYGAALLGWFGRPDPDGNLTMYMSSQGSTNYTGYANRQVDDLLRTATETTDITERARLYGDAVAVLNTDLPYVYLYRQRTLVGAGGVEGIRLDAIGVVRPAFAGLVKQ